jgi:vacuolar-type H+-ATPase subunit E/Vma4
MAIETNRFANSADKNRMYREQIITREDLNEFRNLLLNDLKEIIQSKSQQTKQWLKSNEVRKLLNISPGTLQNLRINGTLTYTKIGGIMYYDNSDIDKVLNSNKVNAIPTLFK